MMTIPTGWRKVKPDEIILHGDKFEDLGYFSLCRSSIGTACKKNFPDDNLVIRKIEKYKPEKLNKIKYSEKQYRELKEGEIISEEDIVDIGGQFVVRTADIGEKYDKLKFARTYRKKETIDKSNKINEWKFFEYPSKDSGFLFFVSNQNGGFVIDSKGNPSSSSFLGCWSIYSLRGANSSIVDTREALRKLGHVGKNNLFKFLKIPLEKIVISEEKKNHIINDLKHARAFNEDSAMEVSEEVENIFYQLAEENVIQNYKDRFYIKKC